VARERELAWLEGRLEDALTGNGQVLFVAGGPGRGKTTHLAEFSRQAMASYPDLLVASGTCNVYSNSTYTRDWMRGSAHCRMARLPGFWKSCIRAGSKK
jgi:Cdc6-like AAA superfamily ATPase